MDGSPIQTHHRNSSLNHHDDEFQMTSQKYSGRRFNKSVVREEDQTGPTDEEDIMLPNINTAK